MHRWIRRWGALAGVCLLVTETTAEDRLTGVHAFILRGDGAQLLRSLSSSHTQAALVDADKVRELCESACQNVLWLYHGDQSETVEAADLLLNFAVGCFARDDKDADAHAALGAAHLMRARLRHIDSDEEDAGKDFSEAVRNYQSAYILNITDPETLRWSVIAAMESLRDPDTEDPDAVQAKAQESVRRLEKQFPLSPAAVHARGVFDLARAESDIDSAKMSKEIGALRKMVTNLLTMLQPFAKNDIDAGTTYNDAISFIRNHKKKLPLKFDYVAKLKSKQGLWMSIPHSRRWQSSGSIYQWDREGHILRTILFDTYSWRIEYTYGSKGIGGDNPKGLCSYDIESMTDMFSKIRRRRPATKGRMNRNISGCYFYTLQGFGEYGDPLTIRGYYFKSKEQRITHSITLLDWKSKKSIDPAGEFFIRSMTQKRPKKKRR